MRTRLIALGGCPAVSLIAYSLVGTSAERAANAASVRTSPGGTAHVGGWGRGGYPMVTGPAAATVNAAATTSMNWAAATAQ